MVRAFLFDLDGTLVDSERENAESIARVLAARGRQLTREERDFVVGHGWREIYDRLAGGGDLDLSFEALKEAAAVEKERICGADGLRAIPGAAEFVRRCAARAPCAIVSGSSRREVRFCIQALDLGGALAFFIGAEDVRQGKPSPEGYLLAAARLGAAPEHCLVLEDSHAGIAAARAAGMRCIAITGANFLGQDQSAAELRVPDFHALGDDALLGLA